TAPVYPVLLLGRVVQASGSGIMLPLLMTVLLAIIPVHRRGTAMGLMGIVIAFGPAIGPTLSGFLLEHFAWRSLFITILPIVAICAVLASMFCRLFCSHSCSDPSSTGLVSPEKAGGPAQW